MPVRPIARLTRGELSDLNAFRVVERLRSFTQAAVELGVTTSALRHAVRNLETRLGVRLLNRTSRTVSPTEAGARLSARLGVGFDEITEALDEINVSRDKGVGRLRVYVVNVGGCVVIGADLALFV